jgi:hypothetical protein
MAVALYLRATMLSVRPITHTKQMPVRGTALTRAWTGQVQLPTNGTRP